MSRASKSGPGPRAAETAAGRSHPHPRPSPPTLAVASCAAPGGVRSADNRGGAKDPALGAPSPAWSEPPRIKDLGSEAQRFPAPGITGYTPAAACAFTCVASDTLTAGWGCQGRGGGSGHVGATAHRASGKPEGPWPGWRGGSRLTFAVEDPRALPLSGAAGKGLWLGSGAAGPTGSRPSSGGLASGRPRKRRRRGRRGRGGGRSP